MNIKLSLKLGVLAGFIGTVASADTIYDPVLDFSTSANSDSTTWSYRRATDLNRDGDYDLLAHYATAASWNPDSGIWSPSSNPTFNPGIGANTTGSPIAFAGNPWSWPTDSIWMHPNPNELIVVSWLSPKTGTANIEFTFADMDSFGGDGVNWYVDLGDSSGNLQSGSFLNGGSSGLRSVSDLVVATGDRIHFIVDPKLSNHTFDSTMFTASISVSPIPEPSTLAFIGVFGGGLWFVRRYFPSV